MLLVSSLAADSTGLYSVYAQYQECEIMFHVSTMLPFTPNNRQQVGAWYLFVLISVPCLYN